MPQDRVVICLKWGTLYAAEYVNVLFSACRRHISGPFRFVCLTDDTAGLNDAIETFPIPQMNLEQGHWDKGGWAKLCVFADDLYGLAGRCLLIDLDSVIVGSLDALFDHPGDLVVIDVGPNWIKSRQVGEPLAGTGVFVFNLGQNHAVFDTFMANRDVMVARHRIEQVYLQAVAPHLDFWPDEWVISFKYHLRRPVGLGLVLPPRAPGPNTRIVAFHGAPRPSDLLRCGWWGIPPNIGRGPVDWMVRYWRDNGGTLPKGA
jgi:hypothetical protein